MSNKDFRVLFFRSLLGFYVISIVENDRKEETKDKKWFQNTYRLYKKIKNGKKRVVTPQVGELLRKKLKQVEDLPDIYFEDNVWNAYSLVLLTLEHLVYILDDVEYKRYAIDFEIDKMRSRLETDVEYKRLNRKTNKYFTAILELMGEDI